MKGRNKKQSYALFSDNPEFTDDGNPHDFIEWSEKECFGSPVADLASIDKVEYDGLTIYGQFHSDQGRDFKTLFCKCYYIILFRKPSIFK